MRSLRMVLLPLIVLFAGNQEATCFAPILPSKWNARTQSASVRRVAADSSTTTETTTTAASPFDVLLQPDPAVDAPLPPTYTKCPFTGIMAGPQSFYRQASEALQSPNVFSFLHRDQPTAEVRGGRLVRELLGQEFSTLSSNAVAGISQKVCGTQSLRTIRDKQEHRAVRQLVGVPLSPKQVDRSIPRLEAIGRARISEHTMGDEEVEIVAWDMAESMALDVVCQQILGLNLETQDEIDTFHQKTHTWLKGMWYKEGSPQFEATMESKEYLRAVIDQKINQLLEKGESDGSTVGGLVFATMDADEDNDNNSDRTLSREEVIDNCLVLILGGTETTATNVANALWLMGLHPSVWQTVIKEQEAIVAQYGEALTSEVLLSQTCPYLDAVIHEMMRILPITLVSKRVTAETIVLDGTQVPQGWGVSYNMYLTHQQDPSCMKEQEGGSGSNNMHMDLIQGFQPERWLSPDTKPGKDYIPFGAGPRQCPGAYLAMTEMKAFLSLLAREMPCFQLVTTNSSTTTTMRDGDNGSLSVAQPLDEQIQWNKVSSLMTPEDGVRIRVLPLSKQKEMVNL